MRKAIQQLLPLCLLGACATHALDQPRQLDATSSGSRSPAPFAAATDASGFASARQDNDYSVHGLFHEHHGDFVHDSNPFREDIRASFHLENNTSIRNDAGDYDLYELEVVADHDFIVDPDAMVSVGGTIGTRRYDFSSNFAGADGDENLNQISLRIGTGFFIEDDLLLEAEVEPGIFSDLDGSLDSSDYQFFVKTLATYRYTDEIYLKGGIYVDQVFADLPVYPVLGIAWLLHPQWRFDALIPRSITLSYNPMPALILDIGLDLDGNQYNLRSRAGAATADVTVTTQEMNLFVGADYRLDDHFSIFGKLGTILLGDTEFKGVTGRTKGTLETSTFFELGAGFTF